MRNTARLQVIVLALIGALAWVSVDVTGLRSAIADYLAPPAIAHEAPTATFEAPGPAAEEASPRTRPALRIRTRKTPEGQTWIVDHRPPMVVG